MSVNPESLTSEEHGGGQGLAGLCSPACLVSLLSIHNTFLKLCPPGKNYKEATLTTDQVSALPALRVSAAVGVRGVGLPGSAEGRKELVSVFSSGNGWSGGCGFLRFPTSARLS